MLSESFSFNFFKQGSTKLYIGDTPRDPMEQTINNVELPEKDSEKLLATPDMVLEWKKHHLREGHSIPSTNTYFSFIKRFVDYGILVDQKSVNRFRANNMSGPCAGALKAFFRFLVVKRGFPEEIQNMRFDRSKSTKRFPSGLQAIEVQKILIGMGEVGLKEKLLTLTIFELGLRISEGLKLTWSDFTWATWLQDRNQQGTVNIMNTKRGKFRALPVKPELMEILYSAHQNRNNEGIPIGNLVFDFGIMSYLGIKDRTLEQNKFDYINYASNRYRDLLYRTSKSILGRRINPHKLRHAKAQILMDSGMPIESLKALLGHEKISSTEIYAQASAEKLKKDLQTYDNPPVPETTGNPGVT